MSINNIVISKNSFQSDKKYDIITSNSQYIRKLYKHNIPEDKISKEALYSFYVDYYHSFIYYNGFSEFIKKFSKKPKVLYYIFNGLKILNSKKHLTLFEKVFFQNNLYLEKNTLNEEFNKIQKVENLLYLNHKWLMNRPNLTILDSNYIEKNFQNNLKNYKKELRHINIIKQLCAFINEDFIEVTAGDINNIYNKSWYFQTAQGRYYMIERKNIVTMYNSYTKKEVIKGKLIDNKKQKGTFLNLISKIFIQRTSMDEYYPIQLSS